MSSGAILMHPKRREERAKLLAGFPSNLGVASIAAGFIIPSMGGALVWGAALLALLAGAALHLTGQAILHYVVLDQTEPTNNGG